MFDFLLKHKARLIMDDKLSELKMNLENNYKDLAHAALKSYLDTLSALKSEDKISERDYKKYLKTGEDYQKQMADYHH